MENAEKMHIKKALLSAKVSPAGMNDDQLRAAYSGLSPLNNLAQPKVVEVAPISSSTAPTIAEKIAALIEGAGVSEHKVIELIKKHSVVERLSVEIKTSQRVNAVENAHKDLPRVLKALGAGLNVYLLGGAGTGKTTIAKHCAQGLGLEFYFCGAVFQKYELLGFIDAMGNYQKTDFRQAYENGGVFLFDELDASDAGAIVAFNAAIANGVCAFPDQLIKKHADFYCIAAANTNGSGATRTYAGRNQLDGASLDRFCIFEVGIDEKIEASTAKAAFVALDSGASVFYVETIINCVRLIRKSANELKLNCIVSPRATVDACKLLALGFTQTEALDAALFNKLDATSAAQLRAIAARAV